MPSANRREGLLNEALGYVTKDRNSSYGEPENNFQDIADMWNTQLDVKLSVPLTPTDVALMMAGMKLARLKHNSSHRDSWVDLIGYGACGGGIALEPVDDGIGKYEGTDVVEEYVYSNESKPPLDKVMNAWCVSNYRCGHAEPHSSHKYTRSSGGAILWDNSGPEWCDGYTSNLRAVESNIGTASSVQRDVDAVKRVADKGAHDLFKKCGQFPRCSVCGPQAGE